MAARIKNRVTTREEKALGSIDMNSLLTAGMCTGFVYALLRLLQAGILMIPGIIIAFVFFLWFLGKKGGVPRYMLMVYSWQARTLIAAYNNPKSLAGQVARLLGWNMTDVIINGEGLFASSEATMSDDSMAGLEILDPNLDGRAGGFEIVSDEELNITIR
jgi:hypothetical protein